MKMMNCMYEGQILTPERCRTAIGLGFISHIMDNRILWRAQDHVVPEKSARISLNNDIRSCPTKVDKKKGS